MKVAMIARATLFSVPGGDTTQIQETAAGLRMLGAEVDICLSDADIGYSGYDLLHFFNIIRPADVLRHTGRARLPYVVSTVYVEYGHEDPPGSLRHRLRSSLGADGVEYLKALARRVKNGDRIGSWKYMLRGHRQAVQAVTRGAAMLLPNSDSEFRRFVAAYGIERPHRVVPNGVNVGLVEQGYEPLDTYSGAVLCVGRIEPLKNQLRLIEALNGSGLRLFIHGKPAPNHPGYYQACIEAAGPDCHIGPFLSGADLYRVYASAKVHVLPSFFETTGLVSLEAAAMGCNVVVTKRGDQPDYFGDHAWYCEPDDPLSIRAAVTKAWDAPRDPAFRREILAHYTWEQAAAETYAAYLDVLKDPNSLIPNF